MKRVPLLLTLCCLTISCGSEQKSVSDEPVASTKADLTQTTSNRPKGEYVSVNGINMYYETFGQGEPLLLIHGGSASIESWFNQIPEFAKSFRVIAVDSRGHGRTQDSTNALSYELMASDFVALSKHLDVTNATIVGWSDGGIIGLHLAMHHPKLVKKLVTIGSNFHANGMLDEVKAVLAVAGPDDHPAMLVEGYKALSPDGPEHWPVLFGKLKKMWLTEPKYTETDLKKITCPTLVMVGDRDFVRHDHTIKMFQSILGAQLCVIPGASHYVPVEKPELVNTVILQFLKQ